MERPSRDDKIKNLTKIDLEKPGVDDEPQPVVLKYEDAYQVLKLSAGICSLNLFQLS